MFDMGTKRLNELRNEQDSIKLELAEIENGELTDEDLKRRTLLQYDLGLSQQKTDNLNRRLPEYGTTVKRKEIVDGRTR